MHSRNVNTNVKIGKTISSSINLNIFRFEEPFDASASSNPLSLASQSGDPNKDKVSLVIISLVEQLAAAYEQEDERRVILAKCKSYSWLKWQI